MSGPDGDSRPTASDQSQTLPSNASGAQIDPRDSRWADVKNWANLRLGRFDAATRDEYIKHFDDYREESDCKRCEKNRDFLLQYSQSNPDARMLCSIAREADATIFIQAQSCALCRRKSHT